MALPEGAHEWELLAISLGKTGQYYMELCDGDACRRMPVTEEQAAILLSKLAAGLAIYATELDDDQLEQFAADAEQNVIEGLESGIKHTESDE